MSVEPPEIELGLGFRVQLDSPDPKLSIYEYKVGLLYRKLVVWFGLCMWRNADMPSTHGVWRRSRSD